MLETVQTVLLALALAFIFRAFFVEPFIIPTGSMAESLLGVHATRLCPACGWEFDAGTEAGGRSVGGFVPPPEIVCPNCRLRLFPTPADTFGKSGDRVLVHKWAYALSGVLGPRRWDVIVFRDPASPELHYIKRLVGLPGETVEILDGDLFIDGRIARKPPAVQAGLWTVVFDQSHMPVRVAASGSAARWLPDPPAAWSSPADRVLRVAAGDEPTALRFNAEAARDYLLDFSSYNGRSSGALVGDVRLVAEITRLSGGGAVELELVDPPDCFVARLAPEGIELTRQPLAGGPAEELAHAAAQALPAGRPVAVEFGYLEPSWFFFSVGIFFWPILLALILYRLFFHEPLPQRLAPTIFILLAPPAVGFLAYLRLTDSFDAFARVLFYVMLLTLLLLATKLPHFARLPFFPSSWAYSFPLAAATVASFEFAQRLGSPLALALAGALAAAATLVIAALVVLTLRAAFSGALLAAEG